MSDRNEDLPELEVELLRQKYRNSRMQVQRLRKFNIAHLVVGTLGIIIFSQAISFGRWSEFSSVESNFNEHSLLIAGCGLALAFAAMAAFALHKRIERLEKLAGI